MIKNLQLSPLNLEIAKVLKSIMQSRRAILSSTSVSQKSVNLLSSPQNLADSLSEFANDDPPDTGEVNCTSGITESIRKSLGLA